MAWGSLSHHVKHRQKSVWTSRYMGSGALHEHTDRMTVDPVAKIPSHTTSFVMYIGFVSSPLYFQSSFQSDMVFANYISASVLNAAFTFLLMKIDKFLFFLPPKK